MNFIRNDLWFFQRSYCIHSSMAVDFKLFWICKNLDNTKKV